MLLHGAQSPPSSSTNNSHNRGQGKLQQLDLPGPAQDNNDHDANVDVATTPRRKRKAESQDNERLSKRLSLLNLEHTGQKLYVPVENPTPTTPPTPNPGPASQPSHNANIRSSPERADSASSSSPMHLDDQNHKVYIYSLDDELSDSEPEDGSGHGHLVFLPDIEKHLRKHRITLNAATSPPVPRPVPVNPDGELAGMQVVLYNDPSSLSVPHDRDGVRKAIIDARVRTRDRQRREREGTGDAVEMPPKVDPSVVAAAGAAGAAGGTDPDAMEMD